MKVWIVLLAVVDIILCISLLVLVMMQEGSTQGLGTIGGGADTFFGQNKGRSIDALLKKVTTIIVFIFAVVTVALTMLLDRY